MENITPKDKRIIRMACLKAAAAMMWYSKGYLFKKRINDVMIIAEKFERFVYDVNSKAESKV